MTWTWRGSLPCSRASSRARSPTTTSVERRTRALGLGDDLVGDDEHVAGLVAAVAQQRREVVARAHLGQALSATRERQATAPRRRVLIAAGGCRSRQQPARVRRAAGARVERGAQDREVLGGVDVEHERARLGHAPARAAGGGRLLVALAAARAEARGDGVGRREQQRVGAGAVAVGDDDDVGRAHRAGHQLVDLARVERRAVAGHEQDAVVVALERPVDAGARRVRVAAVVVGDRLGVVGARQRLGAVLAGDHDDLVDPLGRGAARAARR